MRIRFGPVFIVPALVVCLAAAARPVHASTLTFQLNCTLSSNDTICAPHATLGEVTFTELTDGDIGVTVALLGTNEKFKDLMFNFVGTAPWLTAGSDLTTNLLHTSPGIQTNPYDGYFDAGPLADDPFTTTLRGWSNQPSASDSSSGPRNVDLSLLDFLAQDSLGNTWLSVHIQNINCPSERVCDPGSNGPNSLNAAGSTITLTPTPFDVTPVPEPTSLMLLGTGMLASVAAVRRRHRKS